MNSINNNCLTMVIFRFLFMSDFRFFILSFDRQNPKKCLFFCLFYTVFKKDSCLKNLLLRAYASDGNEFALMHHLN